MYHMYHIGTSLAKHRELMIVWRMDAWGQCPCACGQRVHCHGSCWKPSTRLSGCFQILGDLLLILYGFLVGLFLDSCWILPSTNHGLFLTSKIIGEAKLCDVAGWLCETYPYPDAGAAWCSNQLNPIGPSAVVADCVADCVAVVAVFPGHPHRLPMSRSHCGRRAGTPNTSRRRRFYRRVRRAAEPVYAKPRTGSGKTAAYVLPMLP